MANLSWITLKGELQGNISENCGSRYSIGNKSQTNHLNQIMIYGLEHETTRQQNVNHTNSRLSNLLIVRPLCLTKRSTITKRWSAKYSSIEPHLQECKKSIIKSNYSKHIYQTLN